MQRVQASALWILVVFFSVLLEPGRLAAEEQSYYARFVADAGSVSVEFISCTDGVTPIGIIFDRQQIDFEPVNSTTACQVYVALLPAPTDFVLLIVSRNEETTLVDLSISQASNGVVSPEVRSVLIFVGGIIAATLGRVLSVFLDPFYHTMRVYMKFRATKKFFISISDRYDRDVEVSNDLVKVAKGDYLTNYLLSTKLRARVRLLLTHIDEWKEGTLKPNDFRNAIQRL